MRLLVSTEYTNVTDRRTDERTPRKWCDGTGRAMQHCAVKTRRENQITA